MNPFALCPALSPGSSSAAKMFGLRGRITVGQQMVSKRAIGYPLNIRHYGAVSNEPADPTTGQWVSVHINNMIIPLHMPCNKFKPT